MKRKAYHVEESRKGVTWLLVYASTAKQAADKARRRDTTSPDVEVMDWQDEPSGIKRVRRAREEDQ